MSQDFIEIVGAREHNLKGITVRIPRNTLTVITGVSGSGKSSLAFDTIYAEGQRRYVESLSSYARQFLEQMPKPHVDYIAGLSPAISIEQRSVSRNPRSTVATVTEIYDYLRILFANIGVPHCYKCGRPIERQSVEQIVDTILKLPKGTRIMILAPVVRGRKGEYSKSFQDAQREGFVRVKVDGEIYELDEPITLKKHYTHDIAIVIDRLVVAPDIRKRLSDSVEVALVKAEGLVGVDIVDQKKKGKSSKKTLLFSQHFACPHCGISVEEISPRMFSFNSPYGACKACNGLGMLQEIDEDLIVGDRTKSIAEGAVLPWEGIFTGPRMPHLKRRRWAYRYLTSSMEHFDIDIHTPFQKLSRAKQKIIFYGSEDYDRSFEGVIARMKRLVRETTSDSSREYILGFFSDAKCPECDGERLNPASRAVKIGDLNIAGFTRLPAREARAFLSNLILSKMQHAIGEQVIKEINSRLKFLEDVGLEYLTLDRSAGTLSGGEAQRVRLATQIGSQLVGVLYILDEPTIGLHQRDNKRLIDTLTHLRDLGNTVIVVEHDEQTIREADYVVDLGPGAGRTGGNVVVSGTPQDVMDNKESLTGRYLKGDEIIPLPENRRVSKRKFLTIKGARQHNLKNIDVRIPLGLFTCITGVSGSGKSTLILDILYKQVSKQFLKRAKKAGAHKTITGLHNIDKVVHVNQSPIGRTPRSNPVTYTGIFTHIRTLYEQLPESRVRGYKMGRFSFNVKGGRCEHCQGEGMIKIEMHFLPDVYVECDVCKGKRFNRETLEIRYKGRNIADVLDMTVEEALEFFSAIPPVKRGLATLDAVGLSYMHLGQSATTLSGGEAQRIKLSRELGKRSTGMTLYILDEPTTGLHFDDTKKLLVVLQKLADSGNTVVVIEHNLDVIKSADHIIDLGPEGGDQGGEVMATGTPEEIASHTISHTGKFLKEMLKIGSVIS